LLKQLALDLIRKDWFEYRRLIALFTAGPFVPLLMTNRSSDFRQGMLAGLLIGAAYGYAYMCFLVERQRGTLQFLLSLPVRPSDLVLGKYASLYSMVLFTVNVPGLFFGNLQTMLLINAFVLLLSTICMATTVISDKPWAPAIPLWIVSIGFIPASAFVEKFYPDGLLLHLLASHLILLAAFAIVLSPMIAIASAAWFEGKASQQ
jgi:ABC-type Na+ efflux pump permease subunit